MDQCKKYYVYKHTRLDKDEIFYIGIGTKQNSPFPSVQYHRSRDKVNRNIVWKRIVNKTKYSIKIVYESYNREDVEEKEKELVKLYRFLNKGGTLCNLTTGGEKNYERDDNFKKRISEKNKAPVIQYTLQGDYVNHFKSMTEASISSGVRMEQISDCVSLDRVKSGGGFIWIRYTEDFPLKIIPYQSNCNTKSSYGHRQIKIRQLTLDGELIQDWDGLREAEKATNVTRPCISRCAKGEVKQAGGFKWEYIHQGQ